MGAILHSEPLAAQATFGSPVVPYLVLWSQNYFASVLSVSWKNVGRNLSHAFPKKFNDVFTVETMRI